MRRGKARLVVVVLLMVLLLLVYARSEGASTTDLLWLLPFAVAAPVFWVFAFRRRSGRK